MIPHAEVCRLGESGQQVSQKPFTPLLLLLSLWPVDQNQSVCGRPSVGGRYDERRHGRGGWAAERARAWVKVAEAMPTRELQQATTL